MRYRLQLFTASLLLVAGACAAGSSGPEETNKEVVRRFVAYTNAAQWDSLATVVVDDLRRHSAATQGPPVTSRQAFVDLQEKFLVSFPDQRAVIDQIVAEGDYVAVLATYHATHTGPMGDIPATGKAVSSPFLGMLRLQDGMIHEMWVEWDNLAMMAQMGLMPPPAGEPPQ